MNKKQQLLRKTFNVLLIFCLLFGSVKLSAQNNFVGQIMIVPYNFSPQGWHDCDGSLMPIEENEVLFTLIGTTYGGDGVTTFALPDARGRVIVDDGTGNGLSNMVNGQRGGMETVTLTLQQLPSHPHLVNAVNTAGTKETATGSIPANTGLLDKEYSDQAANTTMALSMVSPSGSSQPHENSQPYLTMKCVIALNGIYPSPN